MTITALLVSIFFTVLFLVLAVSLWANRAATERQRQRIAASRLDGPLGTGPTSATSLRPEVRFNGMPWSPAMCWAADALAQAGVDLAPGSLLGGMAVLAIAGARLAQLWLPTAIAIAVGLSLPLCVVWLLRRWRQTRLTKLASQIPYLLETLKAALESGYTLLRGLQMAAESSPEPLAGELRIIIDSVHIGMSLPVALESRLRHVPIADLSFLADAVSIQEETGSSLAQILQNVADSIRSRQRLDDQIRVLTSQSRMSAMIVAALPAVVLGAFSLMRGDYTAVLFHDPIGIRILVAATAMDLTALFIMREIARVDY